MAYRTNQLTTWLGGAVALAMVLGALWVAPAGAATGRELPEKFQKSPYSLMSLSIGRPNDGWQVRAKKLRSTPYLKVRSKSSDLAYGHPALVLMLRRSAKDLTTVAPGSVMLVGDLSRKAGGPLAGHRSHQSGRDADVAFYAKDSKGRPATLTRLVAFDGDGKAKDGSGYQFDDGRNWLLVQSWARDTRAGLSHIFVSDPLRRRLLAFAQSQKRFHKYIPAARALLKQPERGEPHDDHFHVRIACPKRQGEICTNESN